jgi:hypothetical protein
MPAPKVGGCVNCSPVAAARACASANIVGWPFASTSANPNTGVATAASHHGPVSAAAGTATGESMAGDVAGVSVGVDIGVGERVPRRKAAETTVGTGDTAGDVGEHSGAHAGSRHSVVSDARLLGLEGTSPGASAAAESTAEFCRLAWEIQIIIHMIILNMCIPPLPQDS